MRRSSQGRLAARYDKLFIGIYLIIGASNALAWSPAYPLDTGPVSQAQICRGTNGSVHASYTSDWEIHYRYRDGAGHWGSTETVYNSFSFRSAIVADAQNNPHILFPGTGAGDKADMFHARKVNGSWQITNLTNTVSYDEDEPALAADSNGTIHLVYTRASGSTAATIYRTWNGVSWSGELTIFNFGDSYYQRPDISIDAADNVHTVKASSTTLQYRKKTAAGSWLSPVTIANDGSFFAFPKIAAATSDNIAIVVFDQIGSGQLRYSTSNNGGAGWAALQYLVAGHWPRMDNDNTGNAHVSFTWLTNNSQAGYMKWNGTSWTSPVAPAASGNWQGWSDVAATHVGGEVCMVFDDQRATNQITFTANPDLFEPGPVTDFSANPESLYNVLSWQNPSDYDFVGTMIRYRTDTYPSGPADGTLLTLRTNTPGSTDTINHTGLTPGITYYYAAFAYDNQPNYATAATVSVMAYWGADFDHDGDVDMSDFGEVQQCLQGENIRPPRVGCEQADLDNDRDVDNTDMNKLRGCLSGPDIPYTMSCLP